MTITKFKYYMLAGVLQACLPIAVQASTEILHPGTKDNPTEHTIGESSVYLNDGGYYDITGDESEVMTDSVQFNPNAGDKTFYLTLRHVHIDTSSVEGELCGLYIPAGITVELTLRGTSAITGSVYGIYVAENATLIVKNELDEVLTLRGDYGIYNLGKYLNIDGSTSATRSYGETDIFAKYYGIYSPAGLHLKNTDMEIVLTGSATENQPVAGMALGYPDQDNTEPSNLSGNVVTIDASQGENTYGMWLRNGATCFCGWLTLDVSATGCVLHRENDYAGYIMDSANVTVTGSFDGPHHVERLDDWYCDDGVKIDTARILDGNDFPFHSEHTGINNLSIVGRTLYKGWNTLCLPFEYSITPSNGDDTDEARNWIDDFTAYADSSEATDENGTVTTLNFKTITETSLTPNKAYLVHVNDAKLSDGQDEVVVKFTASTAQVGKVYDHSGQYLKTVYHKTELANADSIYKLGRKVESGGEVTNYFDHSLGAGVDAYRAYINTDRPIAESKLLVSFNDAAPTAVETIDRPAGISVENGAIIYNAHAPATLNIYTLGGVIAQKISVHAGRNIIPALPKGIYIIDGKKIALW